jgi:hypothetical protein
MFAKGTGSQDGLDFCYHAWVDIGISKGRDRFLTFIDDPPSGKNSLFLSFMVNILVLLISLKILRRHN